MDRLVERQVAIAAQHGVEPVLPVDGTRVGISPNVLLPDLLPLNALRHSPNDGTNGWFIWAGETLGAEDDFFRPLHLEHLAEWCPAIQPFLGLPPGWRVLLAPGQEEVWFDESLLG